MTMTGKSAYIAFGKQTAKGTPATPNVFVPFTDASIKNQAEQQYSNEQRGVIDKNHSPIRNAVTASQSITVPAYPSGGLEQLLHMAFGSVTTTHPGTLAYLHSFSASQTNPWYTVGRGNGSLNYERYQDTVLKSLRINSKPKAKTEISAELGSVSVDKSQAALTPSYTSNNAFNFSDLSINYDGSTSNKIIDFSMEINRDLEEYHIVGDGISPSERIWGGFEAKGSFEVLFESYTGIYENYLGNAGSNVFLDTQTPKALTATWTGDLIETGQNFTMGFNLPKIYIDNLDYDPKGPDAVKMSCSWTAVYDSASSKTASATLKSAVASI